jgi:hypothetical protein
MYGSLIRRAVLLVPALAVAVCARDARVPRFDEKGRDRDELEALNARARIAAESREKERLERRREYTLAIRLDEPEEECLARLARTRACILTVREFNNAASRWFPPADSLSAIPGPAEADSLRKNLLYTLLEDPYLDARISMSESKDSLQAVLAEAEAERIRNLRQNPGDSALRSLYRKHAALFRARTESTYEILGSSDSAYMDSLWRAIASPPSLAAGAEPPPWRIVPERAIPSQARAALASRKPGETPPPWKTPYGFFLIRLHSRNAVPEVPYAEAVPLLGAIQAQPGGSDARQEELIASYYERNRGIFTEPDSLRLQAWLKPGFKRKRGDTFRNVETRVRRNLPVEDTLAAASLTLPDSLLPAEVRARVAWHPALAPGAFLGPLPSAYGTWYFRILEMRRGKRLLTLEEARAEIAETLFPGQKRDPLERARAYLDDKRNSLRDGLLAGYLADTRQRRNEGLAAWVQRELSLQFIHP